MRTRTLLASLAAATLASGVGLVALSPASADGITVPPLAVPGSGTITLATATSTGPGSVTYEGVGAYSGTQSLAATSTSDCTLVGASTAGNLLGFTGTMNGVAKPVGYSASTSAGSIGVYGQNGTACSQVGLSAKEKLTVALNLANVTDSGAPVANLRGTGARFDIESKGSVVVKAEFTDASGIVDTRYLYTGNANVPSNLASVSTKCSKTGKDTGPDSGSGDNCLWSVTTAKPFTGVVLTPTAGTSFALEGGGDWGSASASSTTQFYVTSAQGTLACNASTTPYTSTDAQGMTTTIQVKRLGNGDGSECVLIPYNQDAQSNVCQFTKPFDLQPTAQFVITCVRTLLPTATAYGAGPSDFSGGSPYVAAPATPIAVEWPDGTGQQIPLTFCPADLYGTSTTGTTTTDVWDFAWLTAHAANQTSGASTWFGTDMSEQDYLQYACIKSEDAVTLDSADPAVAEGTVDGSVRVTDVVYLTGDILLTTKR